MVTGNISILTAPCTEGLCTVEHPFKWSIRECESNARQSNFVTGVPAALKLSLTPTPEDHAQARVSSGLRRQLILILTDEFSYEDIAIVTPQANAVVELCMPQNANAIEN